MVTDVTELTSVENLRDATLEAYGAVHVLCNNAGIGSGADGHFWEHHVNDWRWSLDVNVMGVVNGINAFVGTMLEQDTEGAVVNTTSGNGGFTPLVNSAIYATTKAAVTCLTECLWGQLRQLDAKVSAHLLYPSTRTPGMMKTGIWQPGRNRLPRYDRPGAPPAETGRDGLPGLLERAKAAGQEVTFAPLSEVADLCFDGIKRRPVLDLPARRRRGIAWRARSRKPPVQRPTTCCKDRCSSPEARDAIRIDSKMISRPVT